MRSENSALIDPKTTERHSTMVPNSPACPYCQSSTVEFLHLQHTTVYRCDNRNCRLQFASPQPDDCALSEAYDHLYYPIPGNHKAVWEPSPEYTIEQLLKALARKSISPDGKRILDFGCGKGPLLRVLAKFGAEAVGIEQSATARESIHREGFASAHASLDDLRRERPDAFFDLIFMIDVVEHLRCPWRDLMRIGQFLAPHGRLVITTMNTNSLRAKLTGANWRERVNPTHLFYFTPDSLANVLRGTGFGTIAEFTPVTNYSHHGPLRRWLQGFLAICGLQGELLFVASEFSAPANLFSAAS
jgi:2-polyprenyl-3-methyl-5-hydroxy-6-metoxy-1,4-benzoquinol methylase